MKTVVLSGRARVRAVDLLMTKPRMEIGMAATGSFFGFILRLFYPCSLVFIRGFLDNSLFRVTMLAYAVFRHCQPGELDGDRERGQHCQKGIGQPF